MLILTVLILLSHIRYLGQKDYSRFQGLVINKDENKYEIFTEFSKILVYCEDDIKLGSYIYGYTSKMNLAPGPFDYEDYLKCKNIKGYYKLDKYEIKGKYFVLSSVQDFLINVTPDSPVKPYIVSLIYGKKALDKDLSENISNLGIGHLFVMSGMHLSLLLFILSFLLDKIFYFSKPKNYIKLIFLFLMMVITNFSISVMRSSLMIILPIIFDKKKIWTKLDYFSLVFVFNLLLNPRYLFIPSFYFSYLSSFVLIVVDKKKKNKIINTLYTSILLFFISIPLVINLNYKINLLTVFISPILILLFEFILFPLVIISLIIPKLTIITKYPFHLFELIVSKLSHIKSTSLIFGHIHIALICVLFLLSFFILYNKDKKIILIVLINIYLIILALIYLKPLYYARYEILLYDVGQGDSILVKDNKKGINILVDAYGHIESYLAYCGVKKLDVVILTHGDYDHIGAYPQIYDNYQITQIYTSLYTNSERLKEYIALYNISQIKSDDYFLIDDLEFLILGPISKRQYENNNSLVFILTINGYKVLFTGDMEESEEEEILAKYDDLDIDILKCAHHGANTGTSQAFLDKTSPKFILISAGKNNKYGHPNNEYVLNNYKCFITSLDGTIDIYLKDKEIYVKTGK